MPLPRFPIFLLAPLALVAAPAAADITSAKAQVQLSLEGYYVGIVASRRSESEVMQFVDEFMRTNGIGAKRESLDVFLSENGWFAIGIGVAPKAKCREVVRSLAEQGAIPSDSLCSDGSKYVSRLRIEQGRLVEIAGDRTVLDVAAASDAPTIASAPIAAPTNDRPAPRHERVVVGDAKIALPSALEGAPSWMRKAGEPGLVQLKHTHSWDLAAFIYAQDNPRLIEGLDGSLRFEADVAPNLLVVLPPVTPGAAALLADMPEMERPSEAALVTEPSITVRAYADVYNAMTQMRHPFFDDRLFNVGYVFLTVDDYGYGDISQTSCDLSALFDLQTENGAQFDMVVAPASCVIEDGHVADYALTGLSFVPARALHEHAVAAVAADARAYAEALEKRPDLFSVIDLVEDADDDRICALPPHGVAAEDAAVIEYWGEPRPLIRFDNLDTLFVEVTQRHAYNCTSLLLTLRDKEQLLPALDRKGIEYVEAQRMIDITDPVAALDAWLEDFEVTSEGQYLALASVAFDPIVGGALLAHGAQSADDLDVFRAWLATEADGSVDVSTLDGMREVVEAVDEGRLAGLSAAEVFARRETERKAAEEEARQRLEEERRARETAVAEAERRAAEKRKSDAHRREEEAAAKCGGIEHMETLTRIIKRTGFRCDAISSCTAFGVWTIRCSGNNENWFHVDPNSSIVEVKDGDLKTVGCFRTGGDVLPLSYCE